MTYVKADSFAELYKKVMTHVYETPDFKTRPRGMNIHECLDVMMELTNPYSNLFKCEDKKLTLQTGYLKKELSLYLSGTRSAELFTKASAFWAHIKNDDETINSAYGNLIFAEKNCHGHSQFEWAVNSLKQDKDSRQAIMHFNNSGHQYDGVKDFPCTLSMTFHIRDNKLYATTVMRSNDIRKGLQYDLPFFTLVQHLMLLALKPTYPELELGSYFHLSQSLHIYESDFEYAKSIINANLTENSIPVPHELSNLIMSEDIDQIVHHKFIKPIEGIKDYLCISNSDFYNWILA